MDWNDPLVKDLISKHTRAAAAYEEDEGYLEGPPPFVPPVV